tara:strand:+ start:666 stop:851 length:186 start_codon:yes stop_codon:yes gene_type:complete
MWYKVSGFVPKLKIKTHFWLWAENKEKLDKMLKEKDITDIQSIIEEPEPYFEWKALPQKTL